MVTPRGASTLVVTVTSNEMPLPGAEITVSGTEHTVISANQGRAEMGQLPAGAISGTAVTDGYTNMPFSPTAARLQRVTPDRLHNLAHSIHAISKSPFWFE